MTTAQRNAISSPAKGLVIFNTSTDKINYYTGVQWTVIETSTTNSVGIYLTKSQHEGNYNGAVNSNQVVLFQNVTNNTFPGTSPWNTTTGLFTAPFTGYYQVCGSLLSNTADLHQIWLVVNGNRTITIGYSDNGLLVLPFSGQVYLNAGDTVGIHSFSINNTFQQINMDGNHTFLSFSF